MPVRRAICLLCWLVSPLTAAASPFLNTVERADSRHRVILILNYFDTCRAVIDSQPLAFRTLSALRSLAEKTQDGQLGRYVQYLRDTYPKHRNRSHTDNAALFLRVGRAAEQQNDPQIAAVCRHFAGQYYFLNEEYGKAFEHLLAANKAFRAIGYHHIPEISRYLYELAFNYYYFREHDKVVQLLKEALRYPAFNANLAIQTHNTLGMVYTRIGFTKDSAYIRMAERSYRQAQRVAAHYRDSLWIGIIYGSLADLYDSGHRWAEALPAYRADYRLGLKFGGTRYHPHTTALSLANVYWHLGRSDSCLYYKNRAWQLYRRNLTNPAFGRNLDDEYFLSHYYDLNRRYYRSVSNLALAYRYADSLLTLKDRINKRYNSEQISLVEQKRLIQQHQSEVERIEQRNRTQQLQFGALGVLLALVSLLFFLLYQSSRIRRRQEKAISTEQEKLLRLQHQIVEEELRRARADLSVFMDNLHEKNALIDAITAELNGRPASSAPPDFTEAYQNLINSSLLTNDDWDEFRRRFARVYPNFFAQLRTQFTDIKPAEERLLALSKLGIDTRQMSRMLGISPDSIRKTRYRLRKRLGVNGTSPLSALLSDAAE